MSNNKNYFIVILVVSVITSSIFGGAFGFFAGTLSSGSFSLKKDKVSDFVENLDDLEEKKVVKITEESAIIDTVEKASPAVVSIIVTKDLPIIERYYSDPSGGLFDDLFGFDDFFRTPQYRQKGTEKTEVGGGSGFLVSEDGYIVTNKHVVSDEDAEYTVLMNDETKHEAKVLALDPITDLAVLKIEGEAYPYVEFGDSSLLKVGQSVIAIGNSLGEFRNTVSTGVISGMSRSIVAGGAGVASEQLMGLIQTDASINPGNSGGPLLNIAGQVIGINTAMAEGAENIGFAIPVNEIKNTVDSVKEYGRIIRPWLGVRYVQINEEIKESNKLDVDYGALVVRGETRTDLAVIPGSPADKAGLMEGDIILEVNGQKIDDENSLARVVSKLQVGEEVELKILHKGEEETLNVVLEEMKG